MLALLIAVATVLHAVESWIPLPLPLPGVRLGLANIVSLMALVLYGWREASYVVFLRVFLGSLLGGTFLGVTFFMSLGGAFASLLTMVWAKKQQVAVFSLVGISVAGAAAHVGMQIVIAALIVANKELLWYLPYLLVLAIPTGIATGMTAVFFVRKLPYFQ